MGQLGGHVLDHDTQVSPGNLAGLDQLLRDGPGHVDGNGEADPHVPTALAEDGRVDTDGLAVQVDQGPT